MTKINVLVGLLHSLPVDIAINRLYVSENNNVVSFNFTYNRTKYVITINGANADGYEYSIYNTNKVKSILIIDDTLNDQIMRFINE